jgi:hypothetical protein
MQTLPTSFEIHADAYRRELRADAERTRIKVRRGPTHRDVSPSAPGWVRRNSGSILIWIGERLSGTARANTPISTAQSAS